MGIALSKLWGVLFSGKNYKVVIVGLDNAGKTTTLYKLHLGDVVVTQPTIGSNVEHISHRNVHFEAWDLGGQDTLRPSWQSYYLNAHAIILVVDSTDRERMGQVKNELQKLLSNADVQNAVFLILANKQDLADAMSSAEITEMLQLHEIKQSEWCIQASCALTGEGLREGLDWIASRLR